MPTRRRTRIVLAAVGLLLLATAGGIVFLLSVPAPLENWLQNRIRLALSEHYRADVQLQNLHVSLIPPKFEATADNFVLPNRDGSGLPLITVKHFAAEGNLLGLLRTPVHVSWVKLDGLEINVPPKRGGQGKSPKRHTHLANFVIDKVDADGTKLNILRKDPALAPMEFDIRKLALTSAGVGQPMRFQAELSNPTPPGEIQTSGRFGPWNFDDPAATGVGGHYLFQHADLSVFNGISGTLSSTGDYAGILRNIVVDGATDVPDFQLDRGGREVHLTTEFHAVVDGSNGNTYLQPVTAHFLNSTVVTNGEIAGKAGQPGKTINLDVDIHDARVQDVMELASKVSPPVLTGQLRMRAKAELPPGKEPVLQKMLSEGTFSVSGAHFHNDHIKAALAELSRRAQGKPTEPAPEDVAAQFLGDYRLHKRELSFSRLEFIIPGAVVEMKGGYGLLSQTLNFVGDVRLHARLSEMVTGPPHWILVPFDPIFMRHGAGTYLPVSVQGTRTQPQVKVDWKKIFH
jgi:hypothetical protein